MKLYNSSIDRLDSYVGGMLEADGNGPGELFTAIIKDQFERLRDSDRFWFENKQNGFKQSWMSFYNDAANSDCSQNVRLDSSVKSRFVTLFAKRHPLKRRTFKTMLLFCIYAIKAFILGFLLACRWPLSAAFPSECNRSWGMRAIHALRPFHGQWSHLHLHLLGTVHNSSGQVHLPWSNA